MNKITAVCLTMVCLNGCAVVPENTNYKHQQIQVPLILEPKDSHRNQVLEYQQVEENEYHQFVSQQASFHGFIHTSMEPYYIQTWIDKQYRGVERRDCIIVENSNDVKCVYDILTDIKQERTRIEQDRQDQKEKERTVEYGCGVEKIEKDSKISVGGLKFGSKPNKNMTKESGSCELEDYTSVYVVENLIPFDVLTSYNYRLSYTKNQLYEIHFKTYTWKTEEIFKAFALKYKVKYTTKTHHYTNGFGADIEEDQYSLIIGDVEMYTFSVERNEHHIIIYDRSLNFVQDKRQKSYELQQLKGKINNM